MSVDPEQIASDWIHYTRFDPNKAPDDVQERAWVLYDAARREPMVAWAAIRSVIGRYSEVELFGSDDTEAKRLLANLAAGPLEDLLAEHGPTSLQLSKPRPDAIVACSGLSDASGGTVCRTMSGRACSMRPATSRVRLVIDQAGSPSPIAALSVFSLPCRERE